MSNPVHLGYVGLGNIGGPMAGSLAAWPGGLSVYDLSADAVKAVTERGARPSDSLTSLAATADIIGVCVLDDAQVRTVVAGPDGLLSAARAGTIIAIHSTIAPETATELAAVCAEQGVHLVDAPISGGAVGAQEGRLAVMVGGDRESFERLREPYALTAELLVHAGESVGSGTRMKLARNLLHFVSFTATAEAARLAEAAGIDLTDLGKVVRHTDAITGGAGAIMLRNTAGPIAPEDFWYSIFEPVRRLGEKDLALALQLGDQLGVDLPLARLAGRDLAAALGVPHASRGDDQ